MTSSGPFIPQLPKLASKRHNYEHSGGQVDPTCPEKLIWSAGGVESGQKNSITATGRIGYEKGRVAGRVRSENWVASNAV